MRKTGTRISIAIGLALLAAGCQTLLTGHPVAAASATLTDSAGRMVGTASLWQEASGLVHVNVEVACLPEGCKSLTPGDHGLHFHSVGNCAAPAFMSAAGHFNPLGKQHGLNNAAGPHAGDAPNIAVDASGHGKVSFTTDRITLTPGSTSLFDADGTAIVIHSGPDDQISQPAGNSGARVACGVVRLI